MLDLSWMILRNDGCVVRVFLLVSKLLLYYGGGRMVPGRRLEPPARCAKRGMTFALLPKADLGSLQHRRQFRPWGEVEEYGRKNSTYCDYDRDRQNDTEAHWQNHIGLLRVWSLGRRLRLAPQWVRYDATRRGFHVVTRWNRNIDPAYIVAMQALLGSDHNRESFNLARLMNAERSFGKKEKAARWNILFRKKLER